MEFTKIFDSIEVNSIYELKEVTEKDQLKEEINRYVHTNDDVDIINLYDLHYANDKKNILGGLYLVDGLIYTKLLNFYQKEDQIKIKEFLKEFKKEYPSLSQTKKTKKLIFEPIEKMFFGDLLCYKNFLKDLSSKSLFIDTSENNLINEYHQAYLNVYNKSNSIPSKSNTFKIYAKFNKENLADEFLAFNSKQIDIERMLDLIKTSEPYAYSQIKISNNQIKFFVPEDFNRSKITFSNQLTFGEIDKFEENLINCKNGTYKINLFKDDIFEKNKDIQSRLAEKIDQLRKQSQRVESDFEKKYNYERDGSDFYEENIVNIEKILRDKINIARLENPIEEFGNYFYHLKLVN